MRLLLIVATVAEVEPFLNRWNATLAAQRPHVTYRLQINRFRITVVVTGAGIMHTTYHTTCALLQRPYVMAVQAGIAGAYNPSLSLGQVVQVTSEQIADLGAEDNQQFIPVSKMPFFNPDAFPFQNGILDNWTLPQEKLPALNQLATVKGITVNTVAGNNNTIAQRSSLFLPDVESMEGAAFFYTCAMQHIPFCQVRSISNYVAPRNTNNWLTQDAINNLCNFLSKLFEEGAATV
ncbi:MAG TPA: futalosine hydrolase [Chitinophagales bacterium]|nr:futalosine hydrolase [Chitinophagales bacterium]